MTIGGGASENGTERTVAEDPPINTGIYVAVVGMKEVSTRRGTRLFFSLGMV